jgi:hypothetical protein
MLVLFPPGWVRLKDWLQHTCNVLVYGDTCNTPPMRPQVGLRRRAAASQSMHTLLHHTQITEQLQSCNKTPHNADCQSAFFPSELPAVLPCASTPAASSPLLPLSAAAAFDLGALRWFAALKEVSSTAAAVTHTPWNPCRCTSAVPIRGDTVRRPLPKDMSTAITVPATLLGTL